MEHQRLSFFVRVMLASLRVVSRWCRGLGRSAGETWIFPVLGSPFGGPTRATKSGRPRAGRAAPSLWLSPWPQSCEMCSQSAGRSVSGISGRRFLSLCSVRRRAVLSTIVTSADPGAVSAARLADVRSGTCREGASIRLTRTSLDALRPIVLRDTGHSCGRLRTWFEGRCRWLDRFPTRARRSLSLSLL